MAAGFLLVVAVRPVFVTRYATAVSLVGLCCWLEGRFLPHGLLRLWCWRSPSGVSFCFRVFLISAFGPPIDPLIGFKSPSALFGLCFLTILLPFGPPC